MDSRDPQSIFPRGEVSGTGPITWSSEEILARIRRAREGGESVKDPATQSSPAQSPGHAADFAVLRNIVMHIPVDEGESAQQLLAGTIPEPANDQELPEGVADFRKVAEMKAELGTPSPSGKQRRKDLESK
jgi:hypothetical protein